MRRVNAPLPGPIPRTTRRLAPAALALLSLAVPWRSEAQSPSGPGSARSTVGGRTAKDVDSPPFSDAVRVGDTLYLSGKLGLGPDRKPPASAEAEARLALDGMKKTLADAGMTMDDLVSVQVFCPDVTLFDTWNKVYRTYFTKEYPARAFIGSGPLLFGARFEVQGIAVRR